MKKTITKLITQKNILLLLFMATLALNACKDDDDKSPYYGVWNGNYSGEEDSGSFSVLINENGEVKGTATSDSLPNFPVGLEGSVNDNGSFSSSADVGFYEILFNGNLDGSSGFGTWSADSNNLNGLWEAQMVN